MVFYIKGQLRSYIEELWCARLAEYFIQYTTIGLKGARRETCAALKLLSLALTVDQSKLSISGEHFFLTGTSS